VAGTIIGGAIGAVAGGLVGKGAAEAVNPSVENDYWRQNYASRPYAVSGMNYDGDYAPAYRYGWEASEKHAGHRWEDVESNLGRDWDRFKGKSRLEWEKAKNATRDAWDRVTNRVHRTADRSMEARTTDPTRSSDYANDPDRRA
jgi:hypothetical protein